MSSPIARPQASIPTSLPQPRRRHAGQTTPLLRSRVDSTAPTGNHGRYPELHAADAREDRQTPLIAPTKFSTGTFGSGTERVDRVDAEVPQTVVTGSRKHYLARTAASGGIRSWCA